MIFKLKSKPKASNKLKIEAKLIQTSLSNLISIKNNKIRPILSTKPLLFNI